MPREEILNSKNSHFSSVDHDKLLLWLKVTSVGIECMKETLIINSNVPLTLHTYKRMLINLEQFENRGFFAS